MTRVGDGHADDERCRAIARWLDQAHPAWTVWWVPATRRYWALPARGMTVPLLERARPEDLENAIREAEVWHGIETRDGAPAPYRENTARPQPRKGAR
ncbi:hypothetical protein GCM10009678_40250 [Actinomadura kijaniata]|uniref:Uncharacterized protein n=1 Tax=Actinomadura namibiensis TaxID=182080 RepID=A0A7W3LUD3_ACTNM|nr:hypothetical protein [Actinomadura namibiensis]MBA8954483.1 hypothetical protein [Actinomadura namibiensis]